MDISKADAVKLFNDMGEPYKVELIEGLETGPSPCTGTAISLTCAVGRTFRMPGS